MVNSTHNIVYGAFSSKAIKELLYVLTIATSVTDASNAIENIREFFSKYFLTVLSYFKIEIFSL